MPQEKARRLMTLHSCVLVSADDDAKSRDKTPAIWLTYIMQKTPERIFKDDLIVMQVCVECGGNRSIMVSEPTAKKGSIFRAWKIIA